MTLLELKSILKINIHDDASLLTDANANRVINQAMQHVANWAIVQSPDLFIHVYTGSITNASDDVYVIADLSGEDYPVCQQILFAENTDSGVGEDRALEQIDYRNINKRRRYTMQKYPYIFLYEQGFGSLEPENGTNIRVHYRHALPNMTLDADSPGVAAGTGTANKLPEHYQQLIPTYAAMLVLGGQHVEANSWHRLFGEQKAELMNSLAARHISRGFVESMDDGL